MVYKVCFKKESFITRNLFIYLYLFKINNVFSGRDAEIKNVLYAKILLAFAQKMLIFAEKFFSANVLRRLLLRVSEDLRMLEDLRIRGYRHR